MDITNKVLTAIKTQIANNNEEKEHSFELSIEAERFGEIGWTIIVAGRYIIEHINEDAYLTYLDFSVITIDENGEEIATYYDKELITKKLM